VFDRIDHIGVAVEDLDAAISLYGGRFEMELAHRETVESQGVEAVLLDVGEGHVELLRPLGPDTRSASTSSAAAPGSTTSPMPSGTSTRPCSGCGTPACG
jgi:catechol 2,3-dioxygenase-like lactoylglutathione lyase family enzyme